MSARSSLGLLICLVVGSGMPARAQAPRPESRGLAVLGAPVQIVVQAQRTSESHSTATRTSDPRLTAARASDPRFMASRTPAVIEPAHEGDYVQFPFGYGEATIHCARLNACPIELESGERLTDQPMAGDAERWIIATSVTGRGGQVPLVVVKPTDCDLSTNLLIPTDRRVYTLTLVSDRCGSPRANAGAVQRTKFWYPDEVQRTEHALSTGVAPCASAPDVNRAYEVRQPGGSWFRHPRPYAWTPEAVCDDGIHTYIQFPEAARHGEMPVLYQIGESGDKEMVNYTPHGDVIVTDRVLTRGALVVNDGGKEKRVDIANRARFAGDQRGH